MRKIYTKKRPSYKHKTRKIKKNKQKGGTVGLFHIYVFTKNHITSDNKNLLLNVLQSLYGENVTEITNFNEFPYNYTKEQIIQFVYNKKGRPYNDKKIITGFSINDIPHKLNEGIMNDNKLTNEEYALRDLLLTFDAPFKLVTEPHGLWSEGVAIIALTSKN
jgi:hypothetical protein